MALKKEDFLEQTLAALGLVTSEQMTKSLFNRHTPNTITRIFSKTKCAKTGNLNVSDGMQLPESFLAPITDRKLLAAMLNIH